MSNAIIDCLLSTTSNDYSFRSKVNNGLLSFDYFESRGIGLSVGQDREICFEDLSHNITVTHEVDGQGLVVWHVNAFACTFIGVLQKMIANIV